MTNFDLSRQVFSFLKQAGVEKLVVCAGARNAPMVMALGNEDFKIYSYFEERSAAFFALGLIKAYQKPVAIMTTSGTAAAELLPACIEGAYQGLPLILITADRPKSFRGTGSPQTIVQPGLFKNYVESEYDLDVHTKSFPFKWSFKKPLHINVSFDEPLIDKSSHSLIPVTIEKPQVLPAKPKKIFQGVRPLIVVSEIAPQHVSLVSDFIIAMKAPVYAESMSLLKSDPSLEHYIIKSSEQYVKQLFKLELCDSIIRIGGIPTLRFWRDLEGEYKDVPVVNFSDLPYSGLSRDTDCLTVESLKPYKPYPPEVLQVVRKIDLKLQSEKEKLFNKFPLSEPALANKVSQLVGRHGIYLGNSLPIRHWDQFAVCDSHLVYANRGANGIDGQISTYLGWSENLDQSYCLVGDLTTLYDLASLGLTPQLKENKRFIIVLNNFGGQIFKRVFKNDNFINKHQTQFYHWAKMWNWSYLLVSNLTDFKKADTFNTPNVVIEVVPDAAQSEKFWEDWDMICQSV
ncbi:MAG: 2-oxoglutarate decarboxylase / 2-succinyl-6-hydroxy-2,4-cyclohexadiene-carboxylate synthase [Pseudobdellovibrio sp.]|jgi:2-succinyl-5-enolpyruvyl-6-hydroxy-3-cyclohexene-1-carboxylate synthase|nr:2-oxoglutarate decarboxylase / 2-succinyl-6-hydroxy-2,4-cyclohexadiene-carboxylate synthase [Pseudobdellovibrio sp.]